MIGEKYHAIKITEVPEYANLSAGNELIIYV